MTNTTYDIAIETGTAVASKRTESGPNRKEVEALAYLLGLGRANR